MQRLGGYVWWNCSVKGPDQVMPAGPSSYQLNIADEHDHRPVARMRVDIHAINFGELEDHRVSGDAEQVPPSKVVRRDHTSSFAAMAGGQQASNASFNRSLSALADRC